MAYTLPDQEVQRAEQMQGAMALGGPTDIEQPPPMQVVQTQPVAQPVQPTPVQQAPVQPQPIQPSAAQMGGAAPARAGEAAKPYDPGASLEQHLRKRFPDLTPEDLDYAKNYVRAKTQKENFKRLGKEKRALATEYMVSLRDYDRALRAAEKDAEELSMLKKNYDLESQKYTKSGQRVPESLIHPKDDPSLQSRFTKTKADVMAADARRKAAWHNLQSRYKQMTGHDLSGDHELSPMAIRMLMLGDESGVDPTEDMVDEYYRGR